VIPGEVSCLRILTLALTLCACARSSKCQRTHAIFQTGPSSDPPAGVCPRRPGGGAAEGDGALEQLQAGRLCPSDREESRRHVVCHPKRDNPISFRMDCCWHQGVHNPFCPPEVGSCHLGRGQLPLPREGGVMPRLITRLGPVPVLLFTHFRRFIPHVPHRGPRCG